MLLEIALDKVFDPAKPETRLPSAFSGLERRCYAVAQAPCEVVWTPCAQPESSWARTGFFEQMDKVFNLPKSGCHTSRLSRCRPQRRVDLHEIVVHEVERHRGRVHLDFLAEGVRQPRESPHRHSHREVLTLDVRRADVLRVGLSGDRLHVAAQAFGRRCPFENLQGGT